MLNIGEVLKVERINLNLEADDKNEALNKLSDLLYESGALTDKQAFLNDVLEREAVSATGIGFGVAIPHGKSEYVKETTVAIGKTKNGLEWESADDEPIKFIVLLAVNDNDRTGVHVKLLSSMARKLANEETCKLLLETNSPEELIKIFSE